MLQTIYLRHCVTETRAKQRPRGSSRSSRAEVNAATSSQRHITQPSAYTHRSVSTSTASLSQYTPSNPSGQPPSYSQSTTPSSNTTTSSSSRPDGQARPDPALRWGLTPSGPGPAALRQQQPPPDHPIHKISAEEQANMRARDVNPVLKAEMDAAGKGKGGFWRRIAMSGMGTRGAGGGMGGGS